MNKRRQMVNEARLTAKRRRGETQNREKQKANLGSAKRYKQNANAGSEPKGSGLSVHDPRRATEDKEMPKLEDRNLKLENRENIAAMRREENKDLSACDAQAGKEMRSIFGQRGVTLVEMVVVVAIILILMGIGLTYYTGMSKKTLRNDAVTMERELVVATKAYKLDNGNKYPQSGNITPLAPYLNVTSIATAHFDKVQISKQASTGAVGILGAVKDIEDEYCVMWVAREGTGAFDLSKNPLCRWGDTNSGDCGGSISQSYHHDWQACEVGL